MFDVFDQIQNNENICVSLRYLAFYLPLTPIARLASVIFWERIFFTISSCALFTRSPLLLFTIIQNIWTAILSTSSFLGFVDRSENFDSNSKRINSDHSICHLFILPNISSRIFSSVVMFFKWLK